MPGQTPSNTQRFSPSGAAFQVTSTKEAHSTYHCPRCRAECLTFQLRPDVHGVQRSVDVTGRLCSECMESYNADTATRKERIGSG